MQKQQSKLIEQLMDRLVATQEELALALAQNRKLQDIILNGFEEVVRQEAAESEDEAPVTDGDEESKIEKKLREDGLVSMTDISDAYGDAGAHRP